MEISMKLIKLLTPVILSSFVAFSAFAEDQGTQNPLQPQGQQANVSADANQNQQLAATASEESKAGDKAADAKDAKDGEKAKSSHRARCKCKCKHAHKRGHHGGKKVAERSEANPQQSASNETQQIQAQEANQAQPSS